jgi:hypothetical protein
MPVDAASSRTALSASWRLRKHIMLLLRTESTLLCAYRAELDANKYPKGVKVSDAQLAAVNLTHHPFDGDWNYITSATS